jgi:hypothetical protein
VPVPEPLLAFLPESAGPYISMMIGGFVLGIAGHLTRSRWLVAIGIALVFLAALIFPLVLNVTEDDPPQRIDPELRQVQ